MGTEEEAYGVIKGKLEERYQLNTDDYIFGWLDINHMQHVERLNEMNSIFFLFDNSILFRFGDIW